MKEGNHPIFVALKARDLGRAFELSKEDKSWAEVVVCDGPLRGQSVLHLVAGQQPKTARRGHEPWYAEWCDYLVREVCDVPQGSGCLWFRRGGGEGGRAGGRFIAVSRFESTPQSCGTVSTQQITATLWSIANLTAVGLLEQPSLRGQTALHLAGAQGNEAMAKALVVHGAGAP